jgi:hypothetical protein
LSLYINFWSNKLYSFCKYNNNKKFIVSIGFFTINTNRGHLIEVYREHVDVKIKIK